MKNLESIKNNKRFDSLEKKSLSKFFGGQEPCGTGGGGRQTPDGPVSWSCDETNGNSTTYYGIANDANIVVHCCD